MNTPAQNPQTLLSHSADQTAALGSAIAQQIVAGDIIALIGPLGAGKTQLVRGVAAGLGIDGHQVTSPTFVLVHEYENHRPGPPGPPGPLLVHIDAYRISGPADLESIGWERGGGELADDAVVIIEWADRMGSELGTDYLQIELAHYDEQTRQLTFTGHGQWAQRMAGLLQHLKVNTACD